VNARGTGLTEAEILAVKAFVESARHLESHSLIQGRQLRANWTLTLNKGSPAKEQTHKIDYESLESVLVRLRQFAMEREEIHLPRIVNILKPHYPENIEYLRSIADTFLMRKEYGLVKAVADGQEFTEEQLFNDFINSRVFHRDVEKEERLRALGDLLEDGFAYTILLSAVVTKVNAVRTLKAFIESAGVS
jgi:hypothetical protein